MKGPTGMEPALLTAEETARYLGISVTVVKELTREGWIPVVVLRHGSRRDLRRWARASLDELIRQREHGGRLLKLVQGVDTRSPSGAASSARRPPRGRAPSG